MIRAVVAGSVVTLLAMAGLSELVSEGVVPQEAPLCPASATATGGGYYRVITADTVRSQHTRLDQALLEAVRAESEYPPRDVIVDHDFRLRVECPEDWTAPAPSSRPDSMSFTTDTLRLAVGESRAVTALLWRNDSIVGCSGDCSAYGSVPEFQLAYRR